MFLPMTTATSHHNSGYNQDVVLTMTMLRFVDVDIFFGGTTLWKHFNPILPGGWGKIRPLLFFLHHPNTAKDIRLKLSDLKDTPLRHIFACQNSSLNFELLPWQQNYRRYLTVFGSKAE